MGGLDQCPSGAVSFGRGEVDDAASVRQRFTNGDDSRGNPGLVPWGELKHVGKSCWVMCVAPVLSCWIGPRKVVPSTERSAFAVQCVPRSAAPRTVALWPSTSLLQSRMSRRGGLPTAPRLRSPPLYGRASKMSGRRAGRTGSLWPDRDSGVPRISFGSTVRSQCGTW